VREGTLEAAGFAAGTFDAVALHHVIEHLPDPLATLQYARELLRPGGILAIATPSTRSLGRRVFGAIWLHWDPPRHLHTFSARSLADLVRRAGFRVEVVTTPTRGARWAFSASWRIRRGGPLSSSLGREAAEGGAARCVFFQLLEASLPARARLGEELLLTARREV
jgi:2-polyprenyl-3-methyl-5-hydroxy-6-metoxy-1,4-benzoquinol methylase